MTENNSKKKSFEERAATKPTELHERFAQWLFIQTGVKPDLKTVQLAVAFRMDFQRSEDNQAALTAKKEAAAAKEAERVAKRKAALEKELAKLGVAVVVEAPAEEVKADDKPAEIEVKTEEAPAAEVEVKAEVTETKAEEQKVEETPKPRARRSRRSTPQADKA